ncbi:MAG: FecR domain-containing protein, partial [Leptospira sp.]|nr:FecR domain-containing protein [Leptospira sp.]
MIYSLSEKIWIFAQVIVLILLSSLLYYDINKRIEVEGEKVIGSITFKQRTVQRKYASHVVWEDLEQNFPLHNKDSIRTATEADAEITLNDGTKINLSENSMILLNLDEDKTSIDFAYGAVSAKNEGASGASSLSIKSGDNSISVGNGDVKLSKTENKDLSVTVEKGFAEISSSGKEAQKIGADQKASFGADSGKVEIKKVDLKLVSPQDNARFFSKEKSIAVNFEYTKDASLPNINLEISHTSDFKKIISSKKTSDKQVSVSLADGSYYWRVLSGKESSPIRKFTILQNRPVNQISPSNGFKTAVPGSTAYISFSWTKSDLASNYKLDISPDPEFAANVQSSVSTVNYVSLPINKGKYFWRVGANLPTGSGGSAYVFSGNQSFEVVDPEKAKPPKLFNPGLKSVTYSILIEKKGILFNWSNETSLNAYEFQLATNPRFDSIIVKKNVTSNFFELKEKLNSGTYYWRVSGKSSDGKETDFSNVSIFDVKDISSLKTFSPEVSANIPATEVTSKGILFSWEKLPINGKYSLQISEDQNFQKVIKNVPVANNRYILKEINAGSYYWRVSLNSAAGEPYLTSSVNSFSIRYTPESLKLYSPKPNTSLPSNVNSIKFQWSKGNTPNYEFKILIKEDDKFKEILNKTLTTNEYTIEKDQMLSSGNYEWIVVGLGEGGARSSETISRFQILPEVAEKVVDIPVSRIVTLISPIEGQSINISKLNEIQFRWSPIPGIKQYKLTLSDGKKEIFNTTTTKAEYKFSKLEVLDRKTFKWSVSPIDKNTSNEETSG